MFQVVVHLQRCEQEDWFVVSTFDKEEDAVDFKVRAEANETSDEVVGYFVEPYVFEPPTPHNLSFEEFVKRTRRK